MENADTETMQNILEVSINAESGEIDKGLLEAIGYYAGEEGALLTELASAKDKLPRFNYVDYAVLTGTGTTECTTHLIRLNLKQNIRRQ